MVCLIICSLYFKEGEKIIEMDRWGSSGSSWGRKRVYEKFSLKKNQTSNQKAVLMLHIRTVS